MRRKKIKNLVKNFELKDEFDNGELSDYIFDTKDFTIVFDEFDYICPDANKGRNFLFRRGGHLAVVLTINLSEQDYVFLGQTIIDELHYNRWGKYEK